MLIVLMIMTALSYSSLNVHFPLATWVGVSVAMFVAELVAVVLRAIMDSRIF